MSSTDGIIPPHLVPDADAAETRQCGRCREFFPVDDKPLEVDHPSWWLCPACHEKLIGTLPPRRH